MLVFISLDRSFGLFIYLFLFYGKESDAVSLLSYFMQLILHQKEGKMLQLSVDITRVFLEKLLIRIDR